VILIAANIILIIINVIINKVLDLAIGYKVSLFKENLKLRREKDGIILKAYKITLDTILLYRLFN
jgi:hypothetical protein